ncbi:MAG: phosphatidylserine decarboxylase family protein [Candidatus Hydrogenedentes bacterium]|nr:phosphatidylserine decarboxylase family protein [Candidatus Hydrogenedentota bacterium]
MKQPFSAWREGLPYYLPPFLVGIILLALPWGGVWTHWAGVIGVLAGAYVLFFFRDPRRAVPASANAVVSPADGTIVGIEDLESTPHYDGPCRRVSIFLSVFSVHVNRAPFDGTVEGIAYKEGAFKNAMRADTTDINESNTLRFRTEHGLMTVRQISGAVARRIVCRCAVGDSLKKGEKFGMIKFGSRTELYLPPGTKICVTLKQKVSGGATVVAEVPAP